jgi:hypothetical protein
MHPVLGASDLMQNGKLKIKMERESTSLLTPKTILELAKCFEI